MTNHYRKHVHPLLGGVLLIFVSGCLQPERQERVFSFVAIVETIQPIASTDGRLVNGTKGFYRWRIEFTSARNWSDGRHQPIVVAYLDNPTWLFGDKFLEMQGKEYNVWVDKVISNDDPDKSIWRISRVRISTGTAGDKFSGTEYNRKLKDYIDNSYKESPLPNP